MPIIGRNWLNKLNILKVNTKRAELYINELSDINQLCNLKEKFKNVYSANLGRCTSHKFSLKLKADANPIFCKPRLVPFAMKHKIEKELDRLIANGIIEPIESSDWATPIVPIIKPNGDIRICGDYKITVNPRLFINRHPIPRVIDLLSKLENGKVFSKIDLAHAYQQVELDEQSKEYTTITTRKGLFRYNRLSFGIASAPGLFQGLMEKILTGIDGIVIYFDYILVFGRSKKEHDENLKVLLQRLEEHGLTVSFKKCFFERNKVDFLGYQLNE